MMRLGSPAEKISQKDYIFVIIKRNLGQRNTNLLPIIVHICRKNRKKVMCVL